MVGVKPTGITKSEIRKRKNLYLAASKENTRDLPQRSVSPHNKMEKF